MSDRPYPIPVPAIVVPTSGMAVASLVLSLAGLLSFGVLAVGGIICGHIATTETRYGRRAGHGLAMAGLVIGWIQVGGWLLVIIGWLLIAAATGVVGFGLWAT